MPAFRWRIKEPDISKWGKLRNATENFAVGSCSAGHCTANPFDREGLLTPSPGMLRAIDSMVVLAEV
ncbi:MAG TPA: hypothetical protein VF456_27235 [Vicinamibacterales bacterium]